MALRLKFSLPLHLALAFGGLHVIFAFAELVPNGTSGEGAALGFLIYDYPLHWLVSHFDWGIPFRFDSGKHYVLFFSIAGTLMHGVFGYFLGLLVTFLVKKLRPP